MKAQDQGLSWKSARVLVTGGAGFLGSHVVEKLRQRGAAEIFIPRSREYDLVQGEAVRRLLRDARPDLIIHLAARVGGIGANQQNPGSYFYDNLMMGVQLLHEAALLGVKKFVAAGTVCAYPKFATVPFQEQDIWNGYPEKTNAPYGLAKKMLLVQSQAYRQQYGYNSVVLFPVNLYGPRDNFDMHSSHVIPALIRKIDSAMRAKESQVVLWGDGTATREFLYVEDAAEGLLLACERYDDSAPLNLGCGLEIAIAELAARIGDLMGYQGRFVYDPSRPNGQPRRALDTTRAQKHLGFVAAVPLAEGLRRTIAYFQANRDAICAAEAAAAAKAKL